MNVVNIYLVFFQQVLALTSQPQIIANKFAKIIDEDGSKAEVKVSFKHNTTSLLDAYQVHVVDAVYGMYIINIESQPSDAFKIEVKKLAVESQISANLARLNVGSTATLIYHVQFTTTTKVDSSSSRAKVTWKNGQADSSIFGPAYTDVICIKRSVRVKETFISNYGFIILGIVVGVILGTIIAAFILFCLRRYPATKKYILHTNEIADWNSDVERAQTIMVSPAYDEMFHEKDNEEKRNNGIFGRLKRKKDQEVSLDSSIVKLMWRSDLLQGDMESVYQKLDELDSHQYLTLLEYSLNTFIYTWKVVLQNNIENLHKNTNISLEEKNQNLKELQKLFTPYMDTLQEYRDKKSTTLILDTTASTALKIYYAGSKFYEGILDGIKPKLSHMTSNRTKDHVVLKEQQAKHEKELQEHTEKMEEYKETVREAYTNLFTKWLECCHHISGVWLEEHLNKIVNCQLLILYQDLFTLLNSWINNSVIKEVDLLRRKRLISESVDKEFQNVFKYELEQLTTFLENVKIKIAMKEEKRCLLMNADVKKEMHQHYKTNTDEMQHNEVMQYHTKEDKPAKPIEKVINERFEQCFEYADVAKNSSHDCSENLLVIHHNLVEMMKKSLNVFLTRMRTHAQEINRTKVDIPELMTDTDSIYAEPVEMRKPDEVNYLNEVIGNLEAGLDELTTLLFTMNEENKNELQSKNQDFRTYYADLLMKRKSEVLEVVNQSHILFKSIIQCYGPLSWTNSDLLIDNAPNFCAANILKRFSSSDVIFSIKPNEHMEWISNEKKVILSHWPISKKIHMANQIINSEITETYKLVMKRLTDTMETATNNSTIQNFTKDHFSSLMYHAKVLQHEEQVVNISSRFLTKFLQELHASTNDIPTDTTESIALFKKTVKTLLKTSRQQITPAAEKNLKDHLLQKLETYVSTCSLFTPSVNGRLLKAVTFSPEQLANHLFELGKHFQKLEEKVTVAKRVVNENLQLIHALLHQNVIEEHEIVPMLKELALFLTSEEIKDISNHILGGEKSKNFQDIFNFMLTERTKEEEEEDADQDNEKNGHLRKRKKSSKKLSTKSTER